MEEEKKNIIYLVIKVIKCNFISLMKLLKTFRQVSHPQLISKRFFKFKEKLGLLFFYLIKYNSIRQLF